MRHLLLLVYQKFLLNHLHLEHLEVQGVLVVQLDSFWLFQRICNHQLDAFHVEQ